MFVLPAPGARNSPLSIKDRAISSSAVRDPGLLPAAAVPLLSQTRGVPTQKTWQKYSHSQQSSPETNEAVTRGWEKKDQVFLSEQQLRSCTWSPAAIFNKMLLFNIVYCQQPMAIFSWTMHTQASKSLCLSLKLGRIFQELHNDITSLPHSPFPQLSYLSNNIPWNMFPRAWGHSHPKFSVLVGFLTEEVICTNKSLICTLRNPSIKPTKGQRI